MLIKSFSQLLYTDFDVRNITVGDAKFKAGNAIDYHEGRRSNLFHLVLSDTRNYEFEQTSFTVFSGTLLFIPNKTIYKTNTPNGSTGIGICFDLFDKDSELIEFMPGIYTEWMADINRISEDIEQMRLLYKNSPANILSLKIMLLKMIRNLATASVTSSRDYELIKPALDYIKETYHKNLPVSDFAAKCNISESYFRKKFTETVGISPIDYRNELRFAEAKRLYKKNYTLQEIAEKLGYYDASYFSKIYKKSVGDSLKNTFDIV